VSDGLADDDVFRLPDLGEGLTEGTINAWLVEVGQQVRLNDPLVEVETAKASVEVPSPLEGVVVELFPAEGDTIPVGSPLARIGSRAGDERPAGVDATSSRAAPNPRDRSPEPDARAGSARPGTAGPTSADPAEGPQLLVGRAPAGARPWRRRRAARPAGSHVASHVIATEQARAVSPEPREAHLGSLGQAPAGNGRTRERADYKLQAWPPARRMARELGVDLSAVPGTGRGGVVTSSDVRAFHQQQRPSLASRQDPVTPEPRPQERREAASAVQRAMAAAMVASAFTAPHASEVLTVDVTDLLAARTAVAAQVSPLRVTLMLLAAAAVVAAAQSHPMVNNSWDAGAQSVVHHPHINLGVAAATPRGLIVPNIKRAETLSLRALAEALDRLVTDARNGKTSPADMQHGTLTITNVGVFGVDTGTPILNPGESMIVCLGAIRQRPWVHQGQLAIRDVMQVSVSFDHRLIDGQLGSLFLRDLGQLLEDPLRLLAHR
jgi:2-oxoisovalerate dehydrogenase E2 component (dihydrolipoyl transacylase)